MDVFRGQGSLDGESFVTFAWGFEREPIEKAIEEFKKEKPEYITRLKVGSERDD